MFTVAESRIPDDLETISIPYLKRTRRAVIFSVAVLAVLALSVIALTYTAETKSTKKVVGAEVINPVYYPQEISGPKLYQVQTTSKANPARTIVTAPNVKVPLLTKESDRSYVGSGYYTPDGMPTSGEEAVFSTHSLLVPGRPVVNDEYQLAIPHVVEMRLADPDAMPLNNPLFAVIWDADGDGKADYIAHGMAGRDMKFHHWAVYRIVGEKPTMSKVDLKLFLELTPDPEGQQET